MEKEFKNKKKLVDRAMAQAENEALAEGVDISSSDWNDLAFPKIKTILLKEAGFNPQEYLDWEEGLKPVEVLKKEDIKPIIQESVQEVEALKPPQLTKEDMEEVIDDKKWRGWKKKGLKAYHRKSEWIDTFRNTFKDYRCVPREELDEKIEEAFDLAVRENPDDDKDNPELIVKAVSTHLKNYLEEAMARVEGVMPETEWNVWSKNWKGQIMASGNYPNIPKRELSKRLDFILKEGKAQNDKGVPYNKIWAYVQKQREGMFDESEEREREETESLWDKLKVSELIKKVIQK